MRENVALADLDAYERSLADAGVDVTALAADATGTVFSPQPPPESSALASLPAIGAELLMRGALGDGGMGVVRLAEQRALGREVAVKSARGAASSTADEAALVREARIAGALEHPNIVPVHALGRGPDGDVLLVMKRIEGSVWSSLLLQRASPAADVRRHVEVLMDVCRAIQFAHARGVLHRDLKPSNVMVGPFGEVYVLDWGIAVPVGEAPATIWGTPAYMAPEMTTPRTRLDERTDVYLLGSLLHVVLTNRPPHAGKSQRETMHAAHVSAPPVFAEDTPEELASICTRALARDPAARFESALAFRAALAAWVEHASARALAKRASEELAALVRLLDDDDNDDREGAVYRAYSASRFGFEQALRDWPEFAEARAGLRDTLVGLARFELKARRPDRARALIADLEGGAGGLEREIAEVERAVAAAAAERAQLERVGRAFVLGQNSKRFAVGMACLLVPWIVYAFVVGARQRSGTAAPVDAWQMVTSNLLSAAGFVAVAVWLGRSEQDRLVARFAWLTAGSVAAITLFWSAVAVTGGAFTLGFVATHVILLVLAGFCASVLHPRLYLCGSPILLGVPALLAFPSWTFEVNAVALGASVFLVFALWPRRA